jgi:hypothetical protein
MVKRTVEDARTVLIGSTLLRCSFPGERLVLRLSPLILVQLPRNVVITGVGDRVMSFSHLLPPSNPVNPSPGFDLRTFAP